MRKVLGFIIIASLFITIRSTLALYESSEQISSDFTTKKYNLKIDLNGGSISTESITIKNNKTILPVPVRDGYSFEGFSTVAGGEVDLNSAVDDISQIENKEIFVKWNTIDYEISYNLNGGKISNEPTIYNIEESINLPIPVKDGYEFVGWTGSNGTTPETSVTIAKGSTGNKSYTANWETIKYSISYNLNGGTVTNPTTYTIENEDFKLSNPTRTGYVFSGWTGSNGTTPQLNLTIPKGSIGNKTYTANWNKINATAVGVTIYASRSEDYGQTYNQWSKGPWGKYYTNSVSISDVGTWDLVVSSDYVELKGTTVVISENRCYKLEVYSGNNGRNGEFLGSDIECTVSENNNTTSKAYLKVNW